MGEMRMAGMTASVSGGGMLARRAPAVVMNAELRNFTRLSEILEPDRVLQLASAFFSLAAAAVKAQNGEVFYLQNDALVAAFRNGKPAQFALQAMGASQ